MTTPKLSVEEYSAVVSDHNRRVRRGMVEPCPNHSWARVPQDTDAEPLLICVYCLRSYRPDVRMSQPPRGNSQPL